MSRIRDSAGLFLYDFVSTREDFDSLNEDILSHFRPPVAFQSGSSYTTRVCLEQDSEGNSEVHRRLVMHDTGVLTLPSLLLITSEYVSQINSYNCHGLTPLMDYLKYAVEDHQKPVDICEKVNSLIHCGIEFNARSRDGSTILHFAAKHALPELLELLIETNIRFDHCDDAGHTALTYAADAVDRSRIASASIDFAGRAMRSATILLAATQTYSAAFQESLRARPGGSR